MQEIAARYISSIEIIHEYEYKKYRRRTKNFEHIPDGRYLHLTGNENYSLDIFSILPIVYIMLCGDLLALIAFLVLHLHEKRRGNFSVNKVNH